MGECPRRHRQGFCYLCFWDPNVFAVNTDKLLTAEVAGLAVDPNACFDLAPPRLPHKNTITIVIPRDPTIVGRISQRETF